MITYRNKKPQKGSRKDYLHKDNPSFWQNHKNDVRKYGFLNERIQSGQVVFHQFYEQLFIFLFVDNGEPMFADTEGNISIVNNPHYFRKATFDETVDFNNQLNKKGFIFKNNRIFAKKRSIGYGTPYNYGLCDKHRWKHKRYYYFNTSREY